MQSLWDIAHTFSTQPFFRSPTTIHAVWLISTLRKNDLNGPVRIFLRQRLKKWVWGMGQEGGNWERGSKLLFCYLTKKFLTYCDGLIFLGRCWANVRIPEEENFLIAIFVAFWSTNCCFFPGNDCVSTNAHYYLRQEMQNREMGRGLLFGKAVQRLRRWRRNSNWVHSRKCRKIASMPRSKIKLENWACLLRGLRDPNYHYMLFLISWP